MNNKLTVTSLALMIAAAPCFPAAASPINPIPANGVISDFDGSIDDWKRFSAEKASLKVNSVFGSSGLAMEAVFELKEANQWVALSKDTALPDLAGKTIQFQLRSKVKNPATLEVKFVDEDGSIYGHRIPLTTTDFAQQSIPFSNFSYWWGGNSKLDQIQKFEFAVSSEGPTDGSFALDDLRIVSK